jgi:hypothetical protein
MEKIIRVGKIEDQDELRRHDTAMLSGNQRLEVLIQMQSRYFRWDINSKIERVGRLKRKDFQDVSK